MSLLGKVLALEPEGVRVQIGEQTRRLVTLLVPDVAIGDHVLVAGGLIVARLSPEEAEMRQDLLDEMRALAGEPPEGGPHARA